uniref:Uncharacterized protein n=1 Tax=Aegilops tauschii subsp. strangulata TaxID=200361 RepID=A0A453JB15_AEGTS
KKKKNSSPLLSIPAAADGSSGLRSSRHPLLLLSISSDWRRPSAADVDGGLSSSPSPGDRRPPLPRSPASTGSRRRARPPLRPMSNQKPSQGMELRILLRYCWLLDELNN